VGKVFVIALDAVYQYITVRWFYPAEALVVAIALALTARDLCPIGDHGTASPLVCPRPRARGRREDSAQQGIARRPPRAIKKVRQVSDY
jgi:hypothetical protein